MKTKDTVIAWKDGQYFLSELVYVKGSGRILSKPDCDGYTCLNGSLNKWGEWNQKKLKAIKEICEAF